MPDEQESTFRPQLAVMARHVAAPVLRRLKDAVVARDAEAVQRAIESLPEMAYFPDEAIIGTKQGCYARIMGVWSRSHLLAVLKTLDCPPTSVVYPRLGKVAMGHDDEMALKAAAMMAEKARADAQLSDEGLDLAAWTHDGVFHFPNDEFTFDNQEAMGPFLQRNAGRFSGLKLTPEEVKQAEHIANHGTPAQLMSYTVRAPLAKFHGYFAIGSWLAIRKLENFAVSCIEAFNTPAKKTRDILMARLHKTGAFSISQYVRLCNLLMCDGVFLAKGGVPDFPSVANQVPSQIASLVTAARSASCAVILPDKNNPFGCAGILTSGLFFKGQQFQYPSPHLFSPAAVAKEAGLYVSFLPASGAAEIHFQTPLAGRFVKAANDAKCYQGAQPDERMRYAAYFGASLLLKASKEAPATPLSLRSEPWKLLQHAHPDLAAALGGHQLQKDLRFPAIEDLYRVQASALKWADGLKAYETEYEGAIPFICAAKALQANNPVLRVSPLVERALSFLEVPLVWDPLSEAWPIDTVTFGLCGPAPEARGFITVSRLKAGEKIAIPGDAGAFYEGPTVTVPCDAIAFDIETPGMRGTFLQLREGASDTTVRSILGESAQTQAELLRALRLLAFYLRYQASVQGRIAFSRGQGPSGQAVPIPKAPETVRIRADMADELRLTRKELDPSEPDFWTKGSIALGSDQSVAKGSFLWPYLTT